MRDLYIIYLDRYHLGDPLFVKKMAKQITQGPQRDCLIIHGSGEKVERTLEAQGIFPERRRGVLDVDSKEHKRLVERAVREANKEIVGSLTDEVVSTVGIQGTDRGLLRVAQHDGEEGDEVSTGKTGWLEALLKQHVVGVVSSLAKSDGGGVREVWTADAVTAIASALKESLDPTVVFLSKTGQAGVRDATGTKEDVAIDDANDAIVEPEAARHVVAAGWPAILTSPDGLWSDPVRATRLHA
ncbi:acetylglutamate kinase [Longibacter salinarum]|uniref:Acetylglutamate kinase n=1 Tax=Longibacter salinarum TaxID=1850348 RepID=A0A2A8D1H6_9BACT|nr:acetylglutamate kinase [Longibacter salinarum]PEN14744.1 acetylglutamate kinase [Longibacter salinarum]